MNGQVADYFDENLYLEENPDVRVAIANRRQPSAFFHYLHYGQYEDRPGKPWLPNPPGYRFPGPLPPPSLRRRVHNTAELNSFEWIGKTVCDDLQREIDHRLTPTDASRILDFGCGCGRVMAYLRTAFPGHLHGTDLDPEAVAWCQQNLAAVGTFSVNEHMPPLPFDDAAFDIVYSISVFSHLPEEMQTAWLGDLRRVTKPGGYLLLSVQGEAMLPLVSPETGAEFAEKGFVYLQRGGTDGLPDFYQTAFHAEPYIRDHWSGFFEIEAVVPKGVGGNQDLVVCRRPSD